MKRRSTDHRIDELVEGQRRILFVMGITDDKSALDARQDFVVLKQIRRIWGIAIGAWVLSASYAIWSAMFGGRT